MRWAVGSFDVALIKWIYKLERDKIICFFNSMCDFTFHQTLEKFFIRSLLKKMAKWAIAASVINFILSLVSKETFTNSNDDEEKQVLMESEIVCYWRSMLFIEGGQHDCLSICQFWLAIFRNFRDEIFLMFSARGDHQKFLLIIKKLPGFLRQNKVEWRNCQE